MIHEEQGGTHGNGTTLIHLAYFDLPTMIRSMLHEEKT
jgi:hypothetical protein